MKKCVLFLLPCLLVGCAVLLGKFNKTTYQKADKIIYGEIFDDKENVEITDKTTILQIVQILSESKKEPNVFMAKEQLLFVRPKDTLVIYKNGTSFQDARGSYTLSDESEKRLIDLLKK